MTKIHAKLNGQSNINTFQHYDHTLSILSLTSIILILIIIENDFPFQVSIRTGQRLGHFLSKIIDRISGYLAHLREAKQTMQNNSKKLS